jgi:hypothetical protein
VLANAGVDPLEAESWDDFVLSWCQDYLCDPSMLSNDDIRLAVQERELPPLNPEGYQILECDGRQGCSLCVLSSKILLATEVEQQMCPIMSGGPRFLEGFDDEWDSGDDD